MQEIHVEPTHVSCVMCSVIEESDGDIAPAGWAYVRAFDETFYACPVCIDKVKAVVSFFGLAKKLIRPGNKV